MKEVSIKSLLSKVKPSGVDNYSLKSKAEVKSYDNYYKFLVKHKDRKVDEYIMKAAMDTLEFKPFVDYMRKFKAIQIVATRIMIQLAREKEARTGLANITQDTIYKFRAECMGDVDAFLKKAKDKVKLIKTQIKQLPDATITIKSDLSKSKIMKIMGRVQDSHVMVETIERLEDYTGIRRSFTGGYN